MNKKNQKNLVKRKQASKKAGIAMAKAIERSTKDVFDERKATEKREKAKQDAGKLMQSLMQLLFVAETV